MRIFRLILVECSFSGPASTDSSRMAPSCRDYCISFSIKFFRIMGAAMHDLFLVQSQLSCVDLPCSPRDMTLVLKGDKKESKGLESFFLVENLVDLLKTLVAIYVRRLYGFCAL